MSDLSWKTNPQFYYFKKNRFNWGLLFGLEVTNYLSEKETELQLMKKKQYNCEILIQYNSAHF